MPEIGLFGSEGGAPTTGVPTLSPKQRLEPSLTPLTPLNPLNPLNPLVWE